ncbi:hypothetical protein [Haladaptatus halobius]|uniref:hypothetical protein n=1 Tax=Haladaptatus halobius TaxID=2884875 RepID=UPI001D0A62A0|nr:hypothetical protein [Haladaptatus halobius]
MGKRVFWKERQIASDGDEKEGYGEPNAQSESTSNLIPQDCTKYVPCVFPDDIADQYGCTEDESVPEWM